MRTSTKPFTYDDYLALPDDGKRYEIIEGELHMTPAPSTRHQDILLRLVVPMRLHTDEHDLGKIFCAPMDIVLSMTDLVQPDILFIAKERAHVIAERNIVAIPNLIVEIASPSSGRYDRDDKRKLYERYGLPEYWIVDPTTQTIDVFIFFDNHLNNVETLTIGQQLRSRQIEGLVISVDEIFK